MLDQRKDTQRRGSSRATQQVHDSPETGIQHRELSENECTVCFGLYEEDPEPVEWLKCTNEDCNVWSHTNCLEVSIHMLCLWNTSNIIYSTCIKYPE